jgi:hypothetical protein
MRRKVQVYLTDEELAQFRKEAGRRRLSLSRYVTEQLASARDQYDGDGFTPGAGVLPAALEKRLAESVRRAVAERTEALAENLRTVMVMLDQLVLSTLTHLPEIPEAQKQQRVAAGEQRHRQWERQVEGLLRQLRAQSGAEERLDAANGDGAAHA